MYVGHTALSALAFEMYTFGVSHTLKAQNIIAQSSEHINRKITYRYYVCGPFCVHSLKWTEEFFFFLVKWHIWDHKKILWTL